MRRRSPGDAILWLAERMDAVAATGSGATAASRVLDDFAKEFILMNGDERAAVVAALRRAASLAE